MEVDRPATKLCVWKLIIPELFHFNTCVPEMFNVKIATSTSSKFYTH